MDFYIFIRTFLSFLGTEERSAPMVDFTIITLCDHHIVGMGTFGSTSAFLGKGTIVYDDTTFFYSGLKLGQQDPSIYIPLNYTLSHKK